MGRQHIRKIPPDDRDIHTWYTRGEVAEMLGCTRIRVKQLEGTRLHPEIDEKGVRRFNAHEVRALVLKRQAPTKTERDRRTQGQIRAAIFSMFDQGLSHREIVIMAQVTSAQVAEAWEDWQCKNPAELARKIRAAKEAERIRLEEQKEQEEWDRQIKATMEITAKLAQGGSNGKARS